MTVQFSIRPGDVIYLIFFGNWSLSSLDDRKMIDKAFICYLFASQKEVVCESSYFNYHRAIADDNPISIRWQSDSFYRTIIAKQSNGKK